MRSIVAIAVLAATLTLGACGGSRFNEQSLRDGIGSLKTQMASLPKRVRLTEPRPSNNQERGMELATDDSIVFVAKSTSGTVPARATMFLDAGHFNSDVMIALTNAGACQSVSKGGISGSCTWLSDTEWQELRTDAIAYANKNGGQF